jgi:hypothetical protein
MLRKLTTTAAVEASETRALEPEWCRPGDLRRTHGLGRGTVYGLMKAKKIRSCLLRAQGRVSGLRLVHIQSVRDYIASQMQQDDMMGVAE